MTTTAQSIIQRAQITLQDTGTRWPASDLVRYLNDGQREIARLRPDQTAASAVLTLIAGHLQALPAQYQNMIDIPNNASGSKRRITKVDTLQLDAVEPTWRSRTQSGEIKHFMHDMREPRVFQVYPPALNGTTVDAVVSAYPADVGQPTAPGLSYTTVTGDISLPDHWADALLNFVLFKSYSVDAEYGGNAQLAVSYLGLFNAAVGSQLQSTSTVAPQT